MRIICLFIFLFAFSNISFGQKSKMIKVWTKPITGETIYTHYNYNDDNDLVSIDVQFIGINSKYPHLKDNVNFFYGSPQQFYSFLNQVETFIKENSSNTSTKIEGHLINVDEVMGIKGVYIYTNDNLGYRSFTLKSLAKFKSKFVDWCKKNNVPYE